MFGYKYAGSRIINMRIGREIRLPMYFKLYSIYSSVVFDDFVKQTKPLAFEPECAANLLASEIYTRYTVVC